MADMGRGRHDFEGPGREMRTFADATVPGFGPAPVPPVSPDKQGAANGDPAGPTREQQQTGAADPDYTTGGEPPRFDPGI